MNSMNEGMQFDLVESPQLHSTENEGCGHYHLRNADCPPKNESCGNYNCCQP